MKTYYDILEVSRYASDEVIKRAHKVLIKKYHPDLQKEEDKEKAKEQTVKINEAYEVLTDPIRKEKYDRSLENIERLERLKKQNEEINKKKSQNYTEKDSENMEIEIANAKLKDEVEKRVNLAQKDIDEEKSKIQAQMQNDYINYLRNLGYNVKTKDTRTFKEKIRSYLISAVIIIIIFIILSIIYKVPSIYEKIIKMEESSYVFRIISKILKAIVDTIWNLFK